MTAEGAASARKIRALRRLLRAEDAVAGVAETGDDVAVLVQALVHRAGVDLHVGVLVRQILDALGGGDAAP